MKKKAEKKKLKKKVGVCCCGVLTACLDQGLCRLSPADSPGGRRLLEAGACSHSLPAALWAESCAAGQLWVCAALGCCQLVALSLLFRSRRTGRSRKS